jgi:CRP/FNR family transcriptional regulator
MENILETCVICFFKNTLCQGLTPEEFNLIFNSTKQKTYQKGEVIFKQGETTKFLVFLTHGMVKLVYDNHGKELIIALEKAQSILGLANILNEDSNLFSIIAIEECKGCVLDINRIKLLILNNRRFMLEIMGISTRMFRESVFNFISMAHKQSNGRIADVLIFLSVNIYNSPVFSLALSRQELAEFAGCSKELITHTLQRFSSEKIIHVSGKKIEILDMPRLQTISRFG